MAGVAMPAAAKLMADNHLAAGSVAGSGKDGRVTKGDVLAAVASGTTIPTGAPTTALAQVAAPAAPVALGERPEQRVPMTRLRARIAERLLQSQSTNAILTTFNEVNMAPVMEMRKKFQEKFEKEHGADWVAPFGTAVMLGIAYASSIGGVGTIVGTAPEWVGGPARYGS